MASRRRQSGRLIPPDPGAAFTPGQSRGRARFTRYYSQSILRGEDFELHWTDADGADRVFAAEADSMRLAEIEAGAHLTDDEGLRRSLARDHGHPPQWDPDAPGYSRLLRPGRWTETPDSPYGLGIRNNPLAPWVHCAADPAIYPFGSRLTVAELEGIETPDGAGLGPHIWVADSGNEITGALRFDWMVGDDATYRALGDVLRSKHYETLVEAPPALPPEMDPGRASGLQRILVRLGHDLGSGGPRGDGVDGAPGALTKAALKEFQQTRQEIPALEHGRVTGAVTHWFLAQAAVTLLDAADRDT